MRCPLCVRETPPGTPTRGDIAELLPDLPALSLIVAEVRARGGAGATEQRRLLDVAKRLTDQFDALP